MPPATTKREQAMTTKLQDKLDDLNKQIAAKKLELGGFTGQKDKLQKQIDEKAQEYKDLIAGKEREFKKLTDAKAEELKNLRAEITGLTQTRVDIGNDIAALRAQENPERQAIAQLRTDAENLLKEATDKKDAAEILMASAVQREKTAITKKNEAAREEAHVEDLIAENKEQILKLQAERQRTQEATDLLTAAKDADKTSKEELRQAKAVAERAQKDAHLAQDAVDAFEKRKAEVEERHAAAVRLHTEAENIRDEMATLEKALRDIERDQKTQWRIIESARRAIASGSAAKTAEELQQEVKKP